MTLASPLKILDRLLTTTSAYGRTSTLTKLPTVSSTTMMKWYLSASARRRGRSQDRRSGLEGNSVKSDRMGREVLCASRSRRASSSSISLSRPLPKKWQPSPHFCRIFSVSVYVNLR
jgi:hypothetical protein